MNFQIFKLTLSMYNKVRLHDAVLSCDSLTSSYPRSNPLRSNRSVLNVNYSGPRKQPLDKIQRKRDVNFSNLVPLQRIDELKSSMKMCDLKEL